MNNNDKMETLDEKINIDKYTCMIIINYQCTDNILNKLLFINYSLTSKIDNMHTIGKINTLEKISSVHKQLNEYYYKQEVTSIMSKPYFFRFKVENIY